MKMRRFVVVPVVAAGVLAVTLACSNPFAPTSTPSEQAAAIAPEVETAVKGFLGKFNEHDAAGAGEFLADDAAFQWAEDGRLVYDTRTAAIQGLGNFFAGFGGSRLDTYDFKVSMLAEDAAVATFKFTQTVTAGGQASLKAEGVMTLALTQADGSWKILVAHKSANGFLR